MYRLLALIALALTSATGMAQSLVNLAPPGNVGSSDEPLFAGRLFGHSDATNGGLQLIPLWSTPDGRILATVAISGNSLGPLLAPAPQVGSTVDWRLVDVTSFVLGGLQLRLGQNFSTSLNLGQGMVLTPVYSATEPSWCAPSGLPAVGDLGCVRTGNWVARTGTAQLGASWTADELGVDLSYGLSWLRNDVGNGFGAGVASSINPEIVTGSALSNLMFQGAGWAFGHEATLGAQGHLQLGGERMFDLGATLGRIQLFSGAGALPANFNQAALSLGMHHGAFSGVLIGRVLGPNDTTLGNQRWTSLDLGISWRTPWQAELSVGAQNLWSSGTPPLALDPGAREQDASQTRVPYVQYHQDL